MNTRTKRQHYVPQLHLKRFVGDQPKGMIWTHDMERSKTRPCVPAETGFGTNFYSIQDQGGEWYDGLDEWLRDVENKAEEGYAKLLEGETPQGQLRADFATFLSSLYVRSPAMIRASAEGYGRFIQQIMNVEWGTRERFEKRLDQYESAHGPIKLPRDDLWEFHNDKSRYTIQIDKKRGLSVMSASDDIQKILFERRWCLIYPSDGYFITSDSPVYRFVPEGADFGPYGDGGFVNPAAEVTLPLSPHVCLLITGKDLGSNRLVLPRRSVEMLNEMRAMSADRFLYSHRADAPLADLGTRFNQPGIRLDVDGGGPYAEVEVMHRMRSSKPVSPGST